MCGRTGSGEMFSMRDPWGIRPAFYYANDEFVAVASERPVLQTTFDLECEDIQELQPGYALLVSRQGKVRMEQILQQRGDSACSCKACASRHLRRAHDGCGSGGL